MATKDLGTETQFDYLYDGIAQKYPAVNADGKSTVFQFTGSPMQAQWKDGSSDLNAYNFANAISATMDGFYTPKGQIVNNYGTFLNSLSVPSLDKDPQYVKYQQQLAANQQQQQGLIQQLKSGYSTYQAGGGTETQAAWLSDVFGGKPLNDQLTALENTYNTINTEFIALSNTVTGPIGDARDALTSKDNKTQYTDPTGNSKLLPTINIEGNLANDISKWIAYGDTEYDLSVEITGETVITSPWKKIYSTTVTQKCFTTSVETKVDVSRIIQDKSYKLEVKYKGISSYGVTLGGWYNDTFVNPSTAVFSPAAPVNNDSFFGLNGSLHLIPSQIWVVYRPCISLTTTTETFKEQFTADAMASVDWLDIFGVRFDFKAGASMQPVDNGDSTTTITFDSPVTSTPQVVGVTSIVKYNGDTN